MANSYSVEISGRFNQAQLQQELNKTNPQIHVKVEADGANKITQIYNASNTLTRNIKEYNIAAGQTVQITQKLNEETGELEKTQTKITVDEQKRSREILNKYMPAIRAAIKENRTFAAEQEKSQARIAQGYEKIRRGIQENIAKEERENEILDRRLGTLQKVANLQTSNTNDILSQAGLPSDATITASGASTPVAGRGTWQRYIVSVQEAANRFHNYALNVNEATGEMRKLDTGITATNKALAAQGETWDRLIVKVAKWALLTTAIYAPIRAFKEALETLKEVDSELVTIQKVTDLSKSQINELTKSVYSLASAYGRTADELLQMTSTFARAGFESQLEQMTELAALVQNVGDLSGEMASKFIIAANAAWKLEGNYESLMSIIDGMNEVTNKSANDFEGLSEAITVAGSVFANAGESAQTFTAMAGTVIATTQRSGSEVARGLRTIAMNIRQIKGELEDGEIIDEESISDAAKALNSIGVSVSENGELRKVSDVLTDLAKKWGELTSAEQSYVASNLAGKRQANVLIALMQNFDEYEKELKNYAEGAGSALRENEIYLDSWDAKTKILKATWTEFISGIVETDLIKGALDVATGALNLLNNSLVQTAVQGAIVARVLDPLIAKFLALESIQGLGITALFGGSTLPILAIVGSVYALIKAYDYLNVTIDEQKEKIRELQNEYDKLYGEGSELAELQSRTAESLTVKEKARLEYLVREARLQQDLIDKAKARADEMLRTDLNSTDIVTNVDSTYDDYAPKIAKVIEQEREMADALAEVREEREKGQGDIRKQSQGLADIITKYSDTADALERNTDSLNADEKAWLDAYKAVLSFYDALKQEQEATDSVSDAIDTLTLLINSYQNKLLSLKNEIGIVVQAQAELNEQGYISVDTFEQLIKEYPDIIKSSKQLANGYHVESDALGDLIKSKETDIRLTEYSAKKAAIEYINSISSVKLSVNATTDAIKENIKALQQQRIELAYNQSVKNMQDYSPARYRRYLQDVNNQLQEFYDSLNFTSSASSLAGKGSSSSSSSSKNTVLNGINDFYEIMKHRIWLSEQAQSQFAEETKEYKAEVEKQAQYYVSLRSWAEDKASELRKAGYAEESDEIRKLQQVWWEAENWVLSQKQAVVSQVQSTISDYLKDLKDRLDAQTTSIDAQIDKYEALIDLEKAYYNVMQDINKEQSDIDKQLKTAKESYQYLDEATRKLLFNDKDYAILSEKLSKIAEESTALYNSYQRRINNLTEDNIYLAEQLTSEFKNQYELKQKEYEIAKAELGLAKARTTLANAQNNRNTLMLVDGQFQWVADPKAIKEALEDYADAEEEYNDAIRDSAQTRKVTELEATKQAEATEKARLQAEYNTLSAAWQRASDSLNVQSNNLSAVIEDLAKNATPALREQLLSLAQLIGSLTGRQTPTTHTVTNPAGNEVTWTEDSGGFSGDVSGINTSDPTSYYVNSTAGQHLLAGDNNYWNGSNTFHAGDGSTWTRDSSGNVTITDKDGNSYSGENIKTRSYSTGIAGGAVDYTGFAMVHGSKQSPEYVLNSEQVYTLLRNLSTAVLDKDTIARALGVSSKATRYGNESNITTDNSIIVNGMQITGEDANRFAEVARQVIPLYVAGRR